MTVEKEREKKKKKKVASSGCLDNYTEKKYKKTNKKPFLTYL